MTKILKPGDVNLINNYLLNLDHPLKHVVLELRSVILETDMAVGEQVKWNSLSFYYKGEMKPFDPKEYKRDIVVLNLYKKEFVLLVFPTGASINDPSHMLEGNFTDGRKTAKFSSVNQLIERKSDLQAIIKTWLEQVEI